MKRNLIRFFMTAAAAAFLFAAHTGVTAQTAPSAQHKAQHLPRIRPLHLQPYAREIVGAELRRHELA